MLPCFRPTWVWALSIGCLSGLFSPGPLCQGVRPDDHGGIVLRANAQGVVVDVVVTAKNGVPVTGLRREAFEVRENGRPQNITYFEEHTGGTTPMPASSLALTDAAPNRTRATQTGPVTVLLLDGLNTQMRNQIYVRKQMFKYLANPVLGQRMAIFALGARLHYVQGFTDDPRRC